MPLLFWFFPFLPVKNIIKNRKSGQKGTVEKWVAGGWSNTIKSKEYLWPKTSLCFAIWNLMKTPPPRATFAVSEHYLLVLKNVCFFKKMKDSVNLWSIFMFLSERLIRWKRLIFRATHQERLWPGSYQYFQPCLWGYRQSSFSDGYFKSWIRLKFKRLWTFT